MKKDLFAIGLTLIEKTAMGIRLMADGADKAAARIRQISNDETTSADAAERAEKSAFDKDFKAELDKVIIPEEAQAADGVGKNVPLKRTRKPRTPGAASAKPRARKKPATESQNA